MSAYLDVETMVQSWLKTCPDIAVPLTRTGGQINIFKAVPNAAPLPSLVLTRIGGGPPSRHAPPEDVARISFDCWAAGRAEAVNLSQILTGLCEGLAPLGYTDSNGRLAAAEVVSWLWLPDPDSDTPRYVVDALFTALLVQP